MDLFEEIEKHKTDVLRCLEIEDPDVKRIKVDGWKYHVLLECSCTAYKDQLETPKVQRALSELLDICKGI